MANIGLTAADAGTPNGTIRWREGLLLIHYEIDRPKPHEPHDEKPTFQAESEGRYLSDRETHFCNPACQLTTTVIGGNPPAKIGRAHV